MKNKHSISYLRQSSHALSTYAVSCFDYDKHSMFVHGNET